MKQWTIGNISRHKADLGLDDDTVSGLHASLTRTDDGRWVLEDRNSRNGTARLVNGQWTRLSQAQVGFDDRLRFGRAETTVRQLLKSSSPPGPDNAQGEVIPWTQDLIFAISKIRDMAEAKRNVIFVLDLIASPVEQAMRCVVQRRPVNPFSFMVFGGIIYTMITTLGLTLSSFIDHSQAAAKNGIPGEFLQNKPAVVIVVFLTGLMFNMSPFPIFKYFTLKKRHFADFMRLTAVVTGMSWMLLSFVALLANQSLITSTSTKSGEILKAGSILLSGVVIIYNTVFGIVLQKHFWRITYGRTLWCYVLTGLALIPVLFAVLILGALVRNQS